MTIREARCKGTLLIAKLILKANEMGYEVALAGAKSIAPDRLIEIAAKMGVDLAYPVAVKLSGHMAKSLHHDGLAFDLDLYKDGVYQKMSEDHKQLGEYWESLDPNCSNGRDFNDGNHYSYRIDKRR